MNRTLDDVLGELEAGLAGHRRSVPENLALVGEARARFGKTPGGASGNQPDPFLPRAVAGVTSGIANAQACVRAYTSNVAALAWGRRHGDANIAAAGFSLGLDAGGRHHHRWK